MKVVFVSFLLIHSSIKVQSEPWLLHVSTCDLHKVVHVEQEFKQIPSWNISRAARDTAPALLLPLYPHLLSLTGQGSMAQCALTHCEDEDVMGQKTVKILDRRTKDISSAVGVRCEPDT